MTYDDCKKQVAEKHGCKTFEGLLAFGEKPDKVYYTEAAELYAQSKANEAVKEDRRDIVEDSAMAPDNEEFITWAQVGYEDNGAKAFDPVISREIIDRPLPYPDEQWRKQ